MSIKILTPSLPESVADATLAVWHKKSGDFVSKDENIADLETDKIVLEVPAPQSGIISELLQQEGATVLAGDALAIIEPQGASSTAEAPAPSPASSDTNASASPAVRRLLQEKNIDPATITATGKKGRITKADVADYIAQNSPTATAPIDSQPLTVPTATTTEVANDFRTSQRVPMTRLRAKVAERLLQAQQNAAMLTTFNEVDMQSIIDLRTEHKDRFAQQHGVKLGFMSFFTKASIEALKKYPPVNASVDGNDIIYHGYYDMGIAISSPRGLVVPVIKDADQLDFAGIEQSIVDYAAKAADGTLTYEDLSGGTFTITNGGTFGSMLSTPILNPPQCAILGMHAIKERPVVVAGQVVARPVMYLALSYDHRLVDGKQAVQFLVTIKECLESPAHLLLNI